MRPKLPTVATLKAAREHFRAHPDSPIPTGLWDCPTWTREEFHRWFRRRLHAKINRHQTATGRKHTAEWQLNASRDARTINDHTKRIRPGRNLLTLPELKQRYPEINNPEIFCL